MSILAQLGLLLAGSLAGYLIALVTERLRWRREAGYQAYTAFFAACRKVSTAALIHQPDAWWAAERPWEDVEHQFAAIQMVASPEVRRAGERLMEAVQHLTKTLGDARRKDPDVAPTTFVAGLAPLGDTERAFLTAVRRELHTAK